MERQGKRAACSLLLLTVFLFLFSFINVVFSGIPLECRPPPVDEVGSLTYIK